MSDLSESESRKLEAEWVATTVGDPIMEMGTYYDELRDGPSDNSERL